MGGQGLDVPGGRGAHTQRCLLRSGENQAPGVSPPEHTIIGVAAGSTEQTEGGTSRGPSVPQPWLLQEVEAMLHQQITGRLLRTSTMW